MTTTPNTELLPKWECFCDEGYYHLWAVRPMSDKSFHSQQLFHVQSKEEAEALRDLLNTRTPSPSASLPAQEDDEAYKKLLEFTELNAVKIEAGNVYESISMQTMHNDRLARAFPSLLALATHYAVIAGNRAIPTHPRMTALELGVFIRTFLVANLFNKDFAKEGLELNPLAHDLADALIAKLPHIVKHTTKENDNG